MLLICRDGVALVIEASVDYAHNPLGILGHRKIVCNHDNRAPHIVQALKQGQNLYTGLGIEGACGLVGKQNCRIADKCAGNGMRSSLWTYHMDQK